MACHCVGVGTCNLHRFFPPLIRGGWPAQASFAWVGFRHRQTLARTRSLKLCLGRSGDTSRVPQVWRRSRPGRDHVGVDGTQARADGNVVAAEDCGELCYLWRREGKPPPKQTQLGRGTLWMLGWAPASGTSSSTSPSFGKPAAPGGVGAGHVK